MFKSKKLKIVIFSLLGILVCFASVKAATTIGENITTTGNIGIGTTTPSEKLVVIGSSIFEGLARFSDQVNITNQTNLSNEAGLTIDALFTASSSAKMTLRGTSSQIRISSGESVWPTAWALGINTGSDDNPNQDFQIRQETNGSGVVNLARLTILKSNGNVGIGTTNPTSKFSVFGGALERTPFYVSSNGTSRIAVDSTNTGSDVGYSYLSNGFENWQTYVDAGNFFIANATSTKLFINGDSGNIGFGTTTPINLFSVASSSDSIFDVTADGRIGVGTAYPVSFAKMQINYDSASGIPAGLVVSDGGSAHVILGATSTSGFVGNYNNNSFSIRTNNEDRIFIYDKNAGTDVRFGFGTTTPESFFQISKEDATTTIEVGSTATTEKGSCLKLRDSDGNGWTYCTTLDGVLSCSINSCE